MGKSLYLNYQTVSLRPAEESTLVCHQTRVKLNFFSGEPYKGGGAVYQLNSARKVDFFPKINFNFSQ